jgi:hypothetical protein
VVLKTAHYRLLRVGATLKTDSYQGMPSGIPTQLQDLKPASAAGSMGKCQRLISLLKNLLLGVAALGSAAIPPFFSL